MKTKAILMDVDYAKGNLNNSIRLSLKTKDSCLMLFDENFSDLSLIASPTYLFKYRFLNKYYKSITIISDGNFNRGSGFRSINSVTL